MSDQPYIVSARKYRPATFHSVVGQKALAETLKNAVSTGRVAQAYLFCGPRGVGKTSCARIFAKTLNCMNLTPEGEACGECASCRSVDMGNSFNLLELDAASNNSVNDIRDIMDQVNVPPQNGRYRVFIIDEVHMLSTQAFNAFLKTLEEPPKNVVFILATTEKHKILPTILSRCQVYDFKRITVDDIVEHLKYVASREGISADERALGVIAQKADGAMRDALSIFDQVAASCMGNITYDGTVANLNVLDHECYFSLTEAFRAGDIGGSLILYNEVRDKGFDSLFFLNGLAAHVRDLMVAADPRTSALLEVSRSLAERYVAQASSFPAQWYYQALSILNDCEVNYRTAANKQLVVELALVKIASLFNSEIRESLSRPASPAAPSPANTKAAPKESAPQTVAPRPQPHAATPDVKLTSVPPSVASPTRPQNQSVRSGVPRPSVSRLSTIRLSVDADPDESTSDDSSPSDVAGVQGGVSVPLSEERLTEAWQQFIAAHPEQKIVVTTMRTTMPHRTGDNEYTLPVANAGQKAQFDAILPQLLDFIRQRVNNDNFVLRVMLQEADSSHRRLTQREFLAKAVTDNPALSDLLTYLDASFV